MRHRQAAAARRATAASLASGVRNRHDSDDPRPQAVIADGDRPGLPGEPDMGTGHPGVSCGTCHEQQRDTRFFELPYDVAHRAVGPWQAVLLLAVLLRRPNREASNQLSNYDHGQWRTPGDADGGWCREGQQGRKSLPAPGSPRCARDRTSRQTDTPSPSGRRTSSTATPGRSAGIWASAEDAVLASPITWMSGSASKNADPPADDLLVLQDEHADPPSRRTAGRLLAHRA